VKISDLSNEDFLNFNSHIINLIQEFNPDMPKDEIINLFKHMKSKFDKQHQLIKNWIEENSNILLKLDIDIIDIYEKISTIYSYKKEIIEFNDEFARLLHLPDYF
ncbi:MAG: hypothetical protein OEZ01_13030, partial [Candidatus Heimdallarchaeota archaeon]|nr:hypothetical protein [Candidatus Heimdallarchaeota archaeon]